MLSIVTRDENTICSSISPFGTHDALNHPSMNVQAENPQPSTTSAFVRTVTNVGPEKSTQGSDEGTKGYQGHCNILVFNKVNEKKIFKVEIQGSPMEDTLVLSASLK
ncbi:hypothetical protein OIU79_014673 [Salix purpurea]|uniref:Subtilisin-like protease fibronectin type-III domain-containing protein n=1 Tax=Salix purpurea TaxID=77065 RepID=A0A9Q0PRM5_SALPP|nr:hypothetical protein OIU79_014673 [Salix purpurea]